MQQTASVKKFSYPMPSRSVCISAIIHMLHTAVCGGGASRRMQHAKHCKVKSREEFQKVCVKMARGGAFSPSFLLCFNKWHRSVVTFLVSRSGSKKNSPNLAKPSLF